VAYWLLKTEPESYAWENLAHDRRTTWDGITNPLALKHLRAMRRGDLALIYHTGGERAAVGIAEIGSDPFRDPQVEDERRVVVQIRPKKKLKQPVTLDEIKADKTFTGWDLLRIGRLSVVPVPPKMWKRIEQLGSGSVKA
jgi:predicted RNA-binding protein with PUA-like domain